MTITFQGHVELLECAAPNLVRVSICTPMSECGQIVVLNVPAAQAAHWLPGRAVQFTIYAMQPTGDTHD